jgi:hypothetical protein
MAFSMKQGFEPLDPKILINVGALLDVPTGQYVTGKYNESLLLGGLGNIVAVVGRGNKYKSTILHYMMLSAMDRIITQIETSASTYDTEINIQIESLKRFTHSFTNLSKSDIIDDGIWSITDKAKYFANEWYEKLKAFLLSKEENRKELLVTTPFLNKDGSNITCIAPSFAEIDSFTELETQAANKMQEENELGESGANTLHMKMGADKTRILMDIPVRTIRSNNYLLITAQVGSAINIASSPYAAPPPKPLQYMKQGDKIKGVADKFFFATWSCWHAISSSPLVNSGTKGPEYPRSSQDNMAGDTDLNIVTLQQLRCKTGSSGYTIEIVVSQKEGVLPSLTEFNYIKGQDRFGLEGNVQNYSLALLPDVKLSRTTIRNKLDTNEKLRRALNITSELAQLHQFHRGGLGHILCSPKELYEDITKLGYDWDMILSKTRGWWTFNNESHPLKFLSTMDLLKMRAGTYHPYWLGEDKKTIL